MILASGAFWSSELFWVALQAVASCTGAGLVAVVALQIWQANQTTKHEVYGALDED
ncbi:MAG: hypothetical protein HZC42_07050 [Candidatus Eisenbacteria bacterium]|nr:hypothetical protein [Candidatus Eisenbacteria bacterium]